MTHYKDLIARAATMENAREYDTKADQFIFAQECLEAAGMEASLADRPTFVEKCVDGLEKEFNRLLA